MVSSPERPPVDASVEVIEVPLSRIKITTRLRATSEEKVTDIAESVKGIGLLHNISVSRNRD